MVGPVVSSSKYFTTLRGAPATRVMLAHYPPRPIARARPQHNMDPVAALLDAAVCFGAACCIALLEDAVRAGSAELESRTTTLESMPDEIHELILGQLCNALDPRTAVSYGSASKGLREPMQRVGEGASKSLLQQLKEENAAAAALCLKAGVQSCKALREAKEIWWRGKRLSATDLASWAS